METGKAAEILAPVEPKPRSEFEMNRLFLRERGRILLADYTAEEYRMAIIGEGRLAGDWDDKPHRLVYDLLEVIDGYHQRLAALPEDKR